MAWVQERGSSYPDERSRPLLTSDASDPRGSKSMVWLYQGMAQSSHAAINASRTSIPLPRTTQGSTMPRARFSTSPTRSAVATSRTSDSATAGRPRSGEQPGGGGSIERQTPSPSRGLASHTDQHIHAPSTTMLTAITARSGPRQARPAPADADRVLAEAMPRVCQTPRLASKASASPGVSQ